MPAGSHRFQVGTLNCTVLSDGYVAHPAAWTFPNAEPVELPREEIVSPYTCLLVETGRHVMLADTGMGMGSTTSGAILARLQLAGIRPRDVDTVVFTHAHPDHIGGAVDARLRPTFPNARHVLAEAEWDFWMAPRVDLHTLRVADELKAGMQTTARSCLRALRHHVELIAPDIEILPGVRAIAAPGHTPGHLALLLSSGSVQLLNLGDAATHPLHLEHPEWQNGFDFDPDRALATRRNLLEQAATEAMHVMAFHFPFPSVGRIAARTGGGWKWMPGW